MAGFNSNNNKKGHSYLCMHDKYDNPGKWMLYLILPERKMLFEELVAYLHLR